MNKIEQMHYNSISKEYLNSFDEGGHTEMDCEKVASKSAEITKNIAIEFADWLIKELILSSHGKYLSHTPQELFQEFLKTKQ